MRSFINLNNLWEHLWCPGTHYRWIPCSLFAAYLQPICSLFAAPAPGAEASFQVSLGSISQASKSEFEFEGIVSARAKPTRVRMDPGGPKKWICRDVSAGSGVLNQSDAHISFDDFSTQPTPRTFRPPIPLEIFYPWAGGARVLNSLRHSDHWIIGSYDQRWS